MSKEVFVTNNLHRISDHIAEAARKGAGMSDEEGGPAAGSAGGAADSPKAREKMSPETERALRLRHEEFIRFKSDLLTRLTESEAEIAASSARYRKAADEFYAAEALKKVDALAEPDADSSDYQVRLAEVCRSLELIRLEMISLKGRLEHPDSCIAAPSKSEVNLFSEMASISFSQLFRIGLGIGLPLLIALLLSSMVIGGLIVLTFRLGI